MSLSDIVEQKMSSAPRLGSRERVYAASSIVEEAWSAWSLALSRKREAEQALLDELVRLQDAAAKS